MSDSIAATVSLWVSLSPQGRQPALLAPGNGFPPQTYRPLAQALLPELQVWGWVPRPMRTSVPPPADLHWSQLAQEYAAHLHQPAGLPVVGIGHSLGGVMTLMAAVLRPDAFRAVVLLDPVIFEPRVLCALQRWQRRGAPLDPDFPLARLVLAARRRRRVFSSREQAREHFQGRALFRHWHPQALEGYLEGGLHLHQGQWYLVYDPGWEAAIFASVPTDVWRWVRRAGRMRIPALVLFGEHSEMGTPATRQHLRRLWPQATVEVLTGCGHLFPMQVPHEVAHRILAWLRQHPFQGRTA